MRKFLFLMFGLLCTGMVSGQLSGTYTIPGSYSSIVAAVNDVNAQGVGTGVTFNIAAGYTETIADSLILTASGKAGGWIIFQKDPATSGVNPVLSRTGAGFVATSTLGGQGDAVFILQGCDYVMIDGLDVSASDQGIEYGYYLRKTDGTNGCKDITIRNCNITMTKGTSQYVTGIYSSNNIQGSAAGSATGVFVTSTGGRNENVTLTGNTISNVFAGIILRGYNHTSSPYDFYDQNFVVGAPGQGNTIQNYGGNAAAATYGVYLIYHTSPTVSYNTINNAAGGGTDATSTLYGIFMSTSSAGGVFTANNNNVTLNQGSTSGAQWIYVGQPCTSITMNNNTLSAGAFASTTASYLLYASSTTSTVNISFNQTSGSITKTGAGTLGLIYHSGSATGGTLTVSNNTFSNISMSGASTFYGIYTAGSATMNKEVFGNSITGVTGGTSTVYGIYALYGLTTNIYGNQIHSFSTAGTLYGIQAGGTSSVTVNTYDNVIHGLSSTGASSAVYGVYCTVATTNNVYRNNIYDLTSLTNGTVAGIYGLSGSNLQFYNNFISDLRAPAATGINAVNGISFAGGTNATVLFNTIFLNALTTQATFGSSGVYAISTVNLDLRNNVIVNHSDHAGNTGFTVAYRRNGAISPTNYAAASNTNDFHVSSSSPILNYIFYDGTNKDSTITAYKDRVTPRDGGSFNENPPFVNAAVAPFNLHMQLTNTKCESGGTPVSTPVAVISDFDLDARYPNAGYPNNLSFPATAPDVGADEFAGQPSFTCEPPNPGNTQVSSNNLCLGQSVTLSLQNAIVGTGNSYQWKSSSDGTNFSNISGANGSTFQTSPTQPTWYRCQVTCQNGPTSAESTPVHVVFANSVTSTQGASRCGTGSVSLQATVSGGSLNWYDAPTGGTLVGTGSPFATPVIASTTSFYAGADAISPVVTVGKVSPASTTNTTLSNYGMVFTTLAAVKIISVDVFPATTAGTMNIALYNSSQALIYGPVAYSFPAGSGTTPHTVTLNFDVPAGTGYRLLITSMSGGNLVRESSGSTYPYTSTYLNITSGATSLTGTSTTAYYWFYNWKVNSSCTSPRTEVVASVTGPPALTITGSKTICSEVVLPLTVTSPLAQFDSYIWSPATNLFTDAACTLPYDGISSAVTLYAKSSTPASITYTCTATNSVTSCSNATQCTVSYLPAAPVVNATPESHCTGGLSTLTVSPAGGYGGATFQWQESTDNVTFSDIPGATNTTYSTPYLGLTTYYKLLIRNSDGQICVAPQAVVTISSPFVTNKIAGSRCGPGTVQLQATGVGGNLEWYGSPYGGTVLGTGSPFTTPWLTVSDTFYVSSVTPGTILETAGRMAPVTPAATSLNNYGLVFTANQFVRINSVDIYPAAAGGDLSVALYNSSSTLVAGPVFFTYPAGNGTTPYTLNLGFNVPAGAGYRLLITAMSGGNLVRETSGITYPISTSSLITFTSGATSLTGTSTTQYSWFYRWNVMYGCASEPSPVIASVTPAPPVELTDTTTICNNEIAKIEVTSYLPNFDVYTWSPVDHLFTDASATIPYVAGTNTTTVYLKTSVAGLITVTCAAHNNTNGCDNFATASKIVLPQNTSITSSPGSICISGIASLSLLPADGYGQARFQWQSSPDNLTFTDIPGATNQTWTTGTISSLTYFKVKIMNQNGIVCSEPVYAMNVVNPAILSTTPGSRCGFGTVDLAATASAGTVVNWYSAATGGSMLATGSSYTTPVISSTTSYFVAAQSNDGGAPGSVGALDNTIGTGSTTALNYYLYFDVLASKVRIQGVYVYPGAAGNVMLHISTSTGTVLHTVTYPVSASDVGIKTWIPINFDVPQGTGYRMGWLTGGISLYRNTTGSAFPYTWPDVISITGHNFSGYPQYYYYFYDWQVLAVCESARTEIIATVNAAPVISPTAQPSTLCAGESTQLNVTSTNPGYQYTWTPGNLSGANQTVTPDSTLIYTATAHDPVSGCNASETVAVTVLPSPSNMSITPAAPSIMPGAIQMLVANGGVINREAVYGRATTTNTTSGYPGPYNNYYGGAKHQMLILASELSAAGLLAGTPIHSLQFNVTAVGSAFAGSLDGFQIDMGHTTNSVLTSSAFITGLTTVLPPALTPITVGTNTHTFATPFIWNGTDNIVVQTSFSNANTATSTTRSVQTQYSAAGFVAANYYRINSATPATVLAAATPSGSSSNRPNMVLGYSLATTMVWAPLTGLYTDPAATVPYAGESVNTVYSKPAATITYTATGTSVTSGCFKTATVTVTVLNPMSLSAVVTDASCPSTADGAINLTVTAGTPPFTYQWSNGSSVQDIAELLPGSYSVTVTDGTGYQAVGSWTVNFSDPVCDYNTVTGNISTAVCYDAHLELTASNLTVLAPTGNLTLIAGQRILVGPNTAVQPGAVFHGYISTVFCNQVPPLPSAVVSGTKDPAADTDRSGYLVFPNPTGTDFTIVPKNVDTRLPVSIEIFNVQGKRVLYRNPEPAPVYGVRFSEMPAGLYFVKILSGNGVETVKLVKNR